MGRVADRSGTVIWDRLSEALKEFVLSINRLWKVWSRFADFFFFFFFLMQSLMDGEIQLKCWELLSEFLYLNLTDLGATHFRN